MFWSKLWLALVTLAAGAAVAVALLAPRPIGRDLEREAGERLLRAQQQASLVLKVNARQWMDAVAQAAGDKVLSASLEQATRGPANLTLVHKTVQGQLRYFLEKLKVDLVIATDAKGRVIARAGRDEGDYTDGIEGFPLVADALRGLRGDDTWSLDGKLYRVEASPVIAHEKYAGALVLGQEVGGELAQSLKQKLNVDVAFLLRGRVLASSTELPLLARLPMLVDQQAGELQRMQRAGPLAVDGGDKGFLVVLGAFAGEAGNGHKASYALTLPRPGMASMGTLMQQFNPAEWRSLPWPALAPVGGAVLAALILGLILMRLEADRPLKRLQRDAQSLARGEVPRLDDDRHPGKLGTIARAVNTTLDRLGSQVAAKPSTGSMPAIGSMQRRDEPSRPMPLIVPVIPVGAPVKPVVELRKPSDPTPYTPPLTAEPELTPPPVDELPPGPKVMQPNLVGNTESQVTNVARGPKDGEMDAIDAPSGGLPHFNAPPLPPRKLPTPRPAPPPVFDDAPTRAAGTAGELRKLVQAEKRIADEEHHTHPHAKLSPEEEALESELQQVYHDFIETKQRLGEPIEGVTYDKFVVKLKANRTQLISRYACKSVKFQVYVKDGKAALKATPVQG